MRRLLRAPAVRRSAVLAAAVLVAIQLVPYGHDRTNPPVSASVAWPSDRAEALVRGACYDCHSNETDWPWYAQVAPMSWLVRRDVERGRDELNLSTGDPDLDDAAEAVREGSMPPRQYELLHPDARLSASERAELAAVLEALDDADDDDRSGSNRGRG